MSPPVEVGTAVSRVLASKPVDIVVNTVGYAVVGATEEMSVEGCHAGKWGLEGFTESVSQEVETDVVRTLASHVIRKI